MPIEGNASICKSGGKYFLRNPAITNERIARQLTGDHLVGAGDDVGGQGKPTGTFWVGDRLIAVRITDDEIVVLYPFHSSLVRSMLVIADLMTA